MTHSTNGTTSGHTPVLSAGTIKGTQVLDPMGDELGSIEDLMIDMESGQVAFAVLSFGGFLGMGGKLLAIPWKALAVDAEDESMVLDVDREMLEEAQGFDEANWPSTADSTWMDDLHRHYGYEYEAFQRR